LAKIEESVAARAAGSVGGAPAVTVFWPFGIVAAAAWLAAAGTVVAWPDIYDLDYTPLLAWTEAVVAGLLAVAAFSVNRLGRFGQRLRIAGPWLLFLALVFAAWELVTAKFGLLPRPFFTAPQKVVAAFVDDWPRILLCVYYSLRLLAAGVVTGAALGFAAGVAMGWSRLANYWGHPLLRFIGPVPATAWLPVAVFVFPTSFTASMFLIALSTGMPVAVLTWSGVSSVSGAYYDIARTLGANDRFLVLKVAIPAAMPHVFVGLFMGLSFSFAILVVAEMLGVRAGLGWYLQWAQGWAAYGNMWAGLVVMAFLCSGLISLLFLARDHLLAWQKGLLRW
jgi:NitT/TauT family transport system permease protein